MAARICKSLGLLVLALVGALQADDTPEILGAKCEAGTPEACYRLALAYRDGLGVGRDRSRAVDLLKRACDERFYQACFSGCLAGLPTCFNYNRDVYEAVGSILAAAPEERRRAVAESRNVPFLWLFVRTERSPSPPGGVR